MSEDIECWGPKSMPATRHDQDIAERDEEIARLVNKAADLMRQLEERDATIEALVNIEKALGVRINEQAATIATLTQQLAPRDALIADLKDKLEYAHRVLWNAPIRGKGD